MSSQILPIYSVNTVYSKILMPRLRWLRDWPLWVVWMRQRDIFKEVEMMLNQCTLKRGICWDVLQLMVPIIVWSKKDNFESFRKYKVCKVYSYSSCSSPGTLLKIFWIYCVLFCLRVSGELHSLSNISIWSEIEAEYSDYPTTHGFAGLAVALDWNYAQMFIAAYFILSKNWK